jgi:gamma-glutamyl-gamma-aminobutyrate hydrolase PuuD
MKKVLITQRLIIDENHYEHREALDVNWGKVFMELNILPIPLPVEYDFTKYFDCIDIDGVLLTGGNDLNSVTPGLESKKRDVFEKKIIKYAISNDVPVFGICRGMQVIAEFFGGDFKKVQGQVGIEHSIIPNKDSIYFNDLKEIKMVNAFHNYALNNIPNEVLVSATDTDGMVKAIEHKRFKIFAQMWHTERAKNLNLAELSILKNFFESF